MKEKKPLEQLEDKEKELLTRLFEDFKDNIVYDTDGKMIFQVNGLHAEDGKFDDPVVLRAKWRITYPARLRLKKPKIPLQWYAFEIALQELAKSTQLFGSFKGSVHMG